EGDTLITDPDLLARLGFSRDARNVYLAKGAVLDQRSSPAEPKEFGTADFGWTTILGNQHTPHSTLYDYAFLDSGEIYVTSGATIAVFDAQLHFSSGVLLHQVTWFGRDAAMFQSLQGLILRVCQSGIPPGAPVTTILGSGQSINNDSFSFTVILSGGEVVRNLNCAYLARSVIESTDPDTDLTLRKVRAGWQRQVSPSPVSATFPNDVPTTHPYFRFIEALARSGITAGCAPGSFCPNSPITRGEMAVFLSAALGLHFTN
ncbi:MAG TPA: S-layer homology domain-containing protein, partial [Thermoanaerobaculia bacterium]